MILPCDCRRESGAYFSIPFHRHPKIGLIKPYCKDFVMNHFNFGVVKQLRHPYEGIPNTFKAFYFIMVKFVKVKK